MHIIALVVALAVAWQYDGPPPEKAFWAIMTYFVEIALMGTAELVVRMINRSASQGH
jgi:hypothetical protein